MSEPRRPFAAALFLVTVFLSAFLLFQVQPLISRYILPWFGGSPAVWTTCMLFFQVALFGGYVYAHLVVAKLTPRTQMLVHVVILGLAAAMLPIIPSAVWKPTSANDPSIRILLLLTATVGLPYFALSTTGPLLQGWYAKALPGRSPYRLYALSNAGSLLALLTYPFVFEPQFTTQTQATLWGWSFYAFAGCCALCAVVGLSSRRSTSDTLLESAAASASTHSETSPTALDEATDSRIDGIGAPPQGRDVLLWAALAAVPTIMLLATTNQVCTDIAVVPFLWVLPLSLYLLSFILCFDSDRWYRRTIFIPLMVLLTAATTALLWQSAAYLRLVESITAQAAVYFGLMFCICMVCHGELVRLKPHANHLTLFYLSLSAGGALGGLFVGLLAPMVFSTLFELPAGIVAASALLLLVLRKDSQSLLSRATSPVFALLLVATIGGLGFVMKLQADRITQSTVAIARNFYGVVRVDRQRDAFIMRHGQIRHGHQFIDAERRLLPTTYYGHQSGAGLALLQHHHDVPKRVGVIGLGAGTLAAYAQSGDYFRMYEINPAVITMAREYFTYLDDCRGDIEIIEGDARIRLEQETPQHLDVLVLDAFSGDAIPAHLLTRECCELYLKHLNADGLLAFHITNRHVDLTPVCNGLANEFGLHQVGALADRNPDLGTQSSLWILMSRDPAVLSRLSMTTTARVDVGTRSILWTDGWSDLLSVMGTSGEVRIIRDSSTSIPKPGLALTESVSPVTHAESPETPTMQ